MTVVAWITLVRVADETFWCVEDGRRFVRRWKKALRRGRFFEMRHAGRSLWLNPRGITYVQIGVSQHSEQQGDTAHNPADDAPISRTQRRS